MKVRQIGPTFLVAGKTVIVFFGVNSFVPSSTLKIRKNQLDLTQVLMPDVLLMNDNCLARGRLSPKLHRLQSPVDRPSGKRGIGQWKTSVWMINQHFNWFQSKKKFEKNITQNLCIRISKDQQRHRGRSRIDKKIRRRSRQSIVIDQRQNPGVDIVHRLPMR